MFFPPADPDSQLYDMGYTPEEETPACPDEFDDFVTFEASMSSVRSHQCWLHVEWDLGMEAVPGERGLCVTGLRDAEHVNTNSVSG